MSEYTGVLEIIRMFSFDKKSDLEVYCKGLTIRGEDLVDVIFLAEIGQIGLYHSVCRREIIPNHLLLSADDTKDISEDQGKRVKFFRKAEQLFKDRRYLMGHMFYFAGLQKWHFFYFDQRDTQESINHWRYGSHIHFVNYLWPDFSARNLWESVKAGNPKIRRSLHIRFEEHRFSNHV